MFPTTISALVLPALLLSSSVHAAVDLTSVGALTSLYSKSTICNVVDYGAVADNSTDIGPAILKAFNNCASGKSATIYIPPGSYSLATQVYLKRPSALAFQLDGIITLTSNGAFSGNAFLFQLGSDIEFFSSNGKGAINGQGWIERISSSGQNARLVRFMDSENISVHDIILVDSPTFHLIFQGVSNLEAYHITIRGPNIGGTDGIDLTCNDNCYIHDCEVTNRDECVSVKSPSTNVLIEDMYCNHSGGMSIGSLSADIAAGVTGPQVSNITMRNIYSFQCTQMLMIKTYPGGSGAEGYVKDSFFENFWSYDSTYGLDIDQYWQSKTTPNTGAVALSGLTFNNWTGHIDNGVSRGPVVIRGSDIVPVTNVTLTNIDMWTLNGNKVINQCKNVYGTGICAGSASQTSFTSSATSTIPPAAYTSPLSPAWGVSGYGVTIAIPIYTPAAFWSYSAAGAQGIPNTIAIVAAVQTAGSSAVAKIVTATTSKISNSASFTAMKATSTSTSDSAFYSTTTLIKAISTKASSSIIPTAKVAVVSSPSA